MKSEKVSLTLAKPTLDDLIALFKKITGRTPTEQEIEDARVTLEDSDETR
jgi:hypothetical protein